MTPLLITEILGEAPTQGMTRPLFCKTEDDQVYVVKGDFAGRQSLVSEWIAGSIGRELGLNIPSFSMLQLEPNLMRYSANQDQIKLLGKGVLFGSSFQENLIEIPFNVVREIDSFLGAKLLAFDWWIGNGDRSLTEHGGNPNLLWDSKAERLVVIDHNLAFRYDELASFWTSHVFRNLKRQWTFPFQERIGAEFRSALHKLPTFWKEVPDEWVEFLPESFSFDSLLRKLSQFETNPGTFWSPQ